MGLDCTLDVTFALFLDLGTDLTGSVRHNNSLKRDAE